MWSWLGKGAGKDKDKVRVVGEQEKVRKVRAEEGTELGIGADQGKANEKEGIVDEDWKVGKKAEQMRAKEQGGGSWYRVIKCDVKKIKICERMGFVEIINSSRLKMYPCQKSACWYRLCSNDSIQIRLKMAWFLLLGTMPI